MNAGERLARHGLALPTGHTLVSLAERPDLVGPFSHHNGAVWPEFMFHDAVADPLWAALDRQLGAFQLVLLEADGAIAAGCNSAPIAWDATDAGLPAGWDAQFQASVDQHTAGVAPTALGALQIVVRPERHGTGLATLMIAAMRAMAKAEGLRWLIACVRPTEKHRHPRVPIDEYARWTRDDGLPMDPWIRVHLRVGGRLIRGAPESMRIEGTVAEWRDWTGLPFLATGEYLIDFAAAPVAIDLEADRGVYLDPNVWIVHEAG